MDDFLSNRVAECLEDREVLLTGASGFVGKVLLEKLLRSCPGLKRVYVLLRSKKGKSPHQRLQDLLHSELYEKVRHVEGGSLLTKVTPIEGDVSAPDLGLSDEARHLLCSSVSLVFHSAATVRFNEPLTSAVILNVRGTHLMLQLARDMPKLQCFLHVSTAYCHPENKVLYERFYESPCEPRQIIKFVETNSDHFINSMTDKILGNLPNTYVFTKALAERLCEEFVDLLPVAVVRPSIVIPIWKEPLVGWMDNLNGPVGAFIAAGKGVFRTILTDEKIASDFIPVDVVVNAIILASWACVNNVLYEKKDKVFNITSYKAVRVTWREMKDFGFKTADEISLENPLWYGNLVYTKCKFIHFTRLLLFQLLPAFLLDICIRMAGYQPLLVRVQRKVWRNASALQFFIQTEWDFDNTKLNSLANTLNSKEKDIFYCSLKDFKMCQFIENSAKGAKLYILRESLDNLPAARKHYKRLYWLHTTTKVAFYSMALWFILLYFPAVFGNVFGVSELKEYNNSNM